MSLFLIGAFFGALLIGALIALTDRLREPSTLLCHCFICEPCKRRTLSEERYPS